MGVKVIQSGDVRTTDKPFPKLMVGTPSGTVVLFNYEGRGTVVGGKSSYDIGYYSSTWSMAVFTDYTGSITLSNE